MTPTSSWDAVQLERYGRQILVPGIGGRGQNRLAKSRVAIIGTDTLAELVGTALARVGIGTLSAPQELALRLQAGAAPDCAIVVREAPLALFDNAELVVDTALSVGDWHERRKELGSGQWILWLREQAGCGYVGVWPPGFGEDSCPGWFFDAARVEETVAAEFEQVAARAWAAAWASALAVRLLVNEEVTWALRLFCYRVRAGNVEERISWRGNRCEYCAVEAG
jgi:hypothetical protein